MTNRQRRALSAATISTFVGLTTGCRDEGVRRAEAPVVRTTPTPERSVAVPVWAESAPATPLVRAVDRGEALPAGPINEGSVLRWWQATETQLRRRSLETRTQELQALARMLEASEDEFLARPQPDPIYSAEGRTQQLQAFRFVRDTIRQERERVEAAMRALDEARRSADADAEIARTVVPDRAAAKK